GEREAEDQRPQDLPEHPERERERLPELVPDHRGVTLLKTSPGTAAPRVRYWNCGRSGGGSRRRTVRMIRPLVVETIADEKPRRTTKARRPTTRPYSTAVPDRWRPPAPWRPETV